MKVPELVKVSLEVNGHRFEGEVEPRKTLADFLREELGFTGVNLGCEHGVCGACSVLVEGVLVPACLMPMFMINGKTVLTLEGFSGYREYREISDGFTEAEQKLADAEAEEAHKIYRGEANFSL